MASCQDHFNLLWHEFLFIEHTQLHLKHCSRFAMALSHIAFYTAFSNIYKWPLFALPVNVAKSRSKLPHHCRRGDEEKKDMERVCSDLFRVFWLAALSLRCNMSKIAIFQTLTTFVYNPVHDRHHSNDRLLKQPVFTHFSPATKWIIISELRFSFLWRLALKKCSRNRHMSHIKLSK